MMMRSLSAVISAMCAYSDEVTASIDAEVKRIIDECYEKAKNIILEHRDVLKLYRPADQERKNRSGRV